MLRIALRKRIGDFNLDVAFEAPTPGVVALFGRSGSGKTTAANLVAGLLTPAGGHIEIDGRVLTDSERGLAVPPERRRVGYVFQSARLFPHLNILANLRYGQRRAAKRPRGTEVPPAAAASAGFGRPNIGASRCADRGIDVRVDLDEVIALMDLQALLARRPHQLSGGEQQRVALGRALLSQPQLLVLDEPLASLDLARRNEVLPYLEILRDRFRLPMIYISHQFDEVLRLATHVVLMEQGRVVAQGDVGEVSLSKALRDIVGPDAVGAIVQGDIGAVDPATGFATLNIGRKPGAVLSLPAEGLHVGDRVRVQLLARDLILAIHRPHGLSVRNVLQGLITGVEADVAGTDFIEVDFGGERVLVRITREASRELSLTVGKVVWVLVKTVSLRGHVHRHTHVNALQKNYNMKQS